MADYAPTKATAPYPTDGAGNMPQANQQPYPSGQPYPPSQTFPQGQPYPQPPPYESVTDPATDENEFAKSTLTDKSIRRKFIRKVYLILTSQLLITMAIVCIFSFVAVFLVTYITLACCVDCRRRAPGNYICLFIFTLALSYMAGSIAAYHRSEAVLIAISMTVLICVGITIFSIQTKWDFTMCSGLIFVLSLAVFLTGMACLIVYLTLGPNRVLQAVYAGLVLVLFSVLLVVDTQQVIGGRKYELSEEEYIFGAMQLYVDVVMILLALIGLAGASD